MHQVQGYVLPVIVTDNWRKPYDSNSSLGVRKVFAE